MINLCMISVLFDFALCFQLRTKTWLRSSMGKERLIGLVLLNILLKYIKNIQVDEVIDLFAAWKNRCTSYNFFIVFLFFFS